VSLRAVLKEIGTWIYAFWITLVPPKDPSVELSKDEPVEGQE
jgi:hypothetical protein